MRGYETAYSLYDSYAFLSWPKELQATSTFYPKSLVTIRTLFNYLYSLVPPTTHQM
jgi:hypothetical protein